MSVFNGSMRKKHNKINEVCLRLTAAPQHQNTQPHPRPHPQHPGAGQTIGYLMDTQTQQLNNQAQVQHQDGATYGAINDGGWARTNTAPAPRDGSQWGYPSKGNYKGLIQGWI